jgi:hypothetical protein
MAATSSLAADAATTVDDGDVFPLTLTPLEHYLLLDARPDYPMTIVGDLRFSGELRREEFERVVAAALARHPLLRAVVRVEKAQAEWVALTTLPAVVDWADTATPIVPAGGGDFDLRQTCGLRMSVRVGGGASRLVVQVHHACCDGHGAMRFIEDLLGGYALALGAGGDGFALRSCAPAQLAGRDDFASQRRAIAEPRGAWRRHFDALKFQFLKPDPPAAPATTPAVGAAGSFPDTQTRYLTDAESRAIRAAATTGAGTLNDAAIAAVFRALREWNRRHSRRRRERFRVLMPIDLRGRADETLPAANRMTYGFIGRMSEQIDDPRLLESIRDETQYVRRTGAGFEFLDALAAFHRRRLLPAMIRSKRCLATAVLTNMGDPTRRFAVHFPRIEGKCVVGNVVLESLTGSPPLRPLTRVGFGIGTYAGRIVINARCDRKFFGDPDTRTMLDLFANGLLAGAAT